MLTGAQLFTARDLCKNLDDFSETLKKVADIGYTTIQASGTCAFEPEWLKEQLDATGLKCVITHVRPPETFYTETQKVIADHKVFDCKYLGLGSFGFEDKSRYPLFVDTYKDVTKAIKEAGQYFMYHNHGHEFYKENGKNMLERMAEDFPADELGFTLDVCWVQTAGADPAYWIEYFKGRVPCLHIKDRDYVGKLVPLGEGNLNLDRILKVSETSDVEYLLVEQDDCNGEDPIECLRRSYEYLKAAGLR
ncbi:MAG: sugar phosphate isomerase/epimerase [Clostridia bacterium]